MKKSPKGNVHTNKVSQNIFFKKSGGFLLKNVPYLVDSEIASRFSEK